MSSTTRLIHKSAIPGHQVSEHQRLVETLEDLRFELSLRPDTGPVAGLMAVAVRRLMADIYRLISREPGGRALLRLPVGAEIELVQLHRALDDAEAGLAAFRRAHSDPDSAREDGWLVHQPAF